MLLLLYNVLSPVNVANSHFKALWMWKVYYGFYFSPQCKYNTIHIMSQNTETLKSLVDRWRIGPPRQPKPLPRDQTEAWMGGSQPQTTTHQGIISNSQHEELVFNHLFNQATAAEPTSRPAPTGWFAKDVVVNTDRKREDPTGGRGRRKDNIETLTNASNTTRGNERLSRAEGFFDAFCVDRDSAQVLSSSIQNRTTQQQRSAILATPVLSAPTPRPPVVSATVPLTSTHSGSVPDITVLLEGPRPSAYTDTAEEDERRMSSLMDAPTSAFQPLTLLGEKENEHRQIGQKDIHRVAASRHLSIPQSQHSPTVGAMVRMLCNSYDKFEQRIESLRAEEAVSETTRSHVESLKADEFEGKGIDNAKWRLFDVILKLSSPAHDAVSATTHDAVFGLGMVHIMCQVAGCRPQTSTLVTSPLSVLSKAVANGKTIFSILMPSAQYFMLSLDTHQCVGLAMPFSVTSIDPTESGNPSHIIILPSFNVLPLPLRDRHSSASEVPEATTAQPEPFRFYGNPLAAHGETSYTRSPSKGGRSPSRAESRIDITTGFPCGPYPTENAGEGAGEPADDDWHVPLETLQALATAYETQLATNS